MNWKQIQVGQILYYGKIKVKVIEINGNKTIKISDVTRGLTFNVKAKDLRSLLVG